MKGWKKRHNEIREQGVGQTGKRVFLVEGLDDEKAFRLLFNKKLGAEWEQKWLLTNAGNKQCVQDILKVEPEWLGLVDRDEWGEEALNEVQQQMPNLLVLPRFCMESYLIVPDEIWGALPEIQKHKISGGLSTLQKEILIDLDKWVRHGVLWSVINPMWSGIRSLGFQEELLDWDTAQDNTAIQVKLRQWHDFLEPKAIFQRFLERLSEISKHNDAEKLKLWVHGKHFWEKQVHLTLNKLLGQMSESERVLALWNTLLVPDDWEPIWKKIADS
ncbi:MAG: hypothetical protein M0021_07655 [Clostridia bacterium]|nr:hypothetical protein [Clostridia bacterium]